MDLALTRLVFIRHGESHSNANGWISGQSSCKGLTADGRAQAERLRDRLAGHDELRPDFVFSSTMRRAIETAEIVASITDHDVEQLPELIERTSGEAEGMTLAEYEAAYGRKAWSDWTQPLSPGGETHDEFMDRVRSVGSMLVERAEGRTAWVVCHGGVIMGTAMARLGLSFASNGMAVMNPVNSSLSEWWVDPARDAWVLRRYNDHAHLEHEPALLAPRQLSA